MVAVPRGTTVHDKATLAGAFGTPTGTVTFTFFTASSVCTGAAVASGTVTLDARGEARPSATQWPLSAGAYSFRAHYNGEDPNYEPADSPCEPLEVTELTFFFNDTATTEIYTLSLHDALPISVHDKATLAGAFGTPTGTVTFTFFTASSVCTGAAVASGTVTLDASGVAHPSASQGPLSAGAYSFRAHYNGEDPNYEPADSPCEPLTVTALTPTAVTEIHNASHTRVTSVHAGTTDAVNGSGKGAFGTPTGTATFTLFTASINRT